MAELAALKAERDRLREALEGFYQLLANRYDGGMNDKEIEGFMGMISEALDPTATDDGVPNVPPLRGYRNRATATDTNTEQVEVCGGSGNLSDRDKATINEHMERLRADTNTEES